MPVTREHLKMENRQYTVPLSKFNEHIRSHIPRGTQEGEIEVHYSYVFVPAKSAVKAVDSSPRDAVKNPQLKAFLEGIDSFGGLTNDDVDAMKKHTRTFKNEFWLET